MRLTRLSFHRGDEILIRAAERRRRDWCPGLPAFAQAEGVRPSACAAASAPPTCVGRSPRALAGVAAACGRDRIAEVHRSSAKPPSGLGLLPNTLMTAAPPSFPECIHIGRNARSSFDSAEASPTAEHQKDTAVRTTGAAAETIWETYVMAYWRTRRECDDAQWDLMLLDGDDLPVLFCRCLESSATGMNLEAPSCGRVVVGREYRLCARIVEAPPRMIGSAHVLVSRCSVVACGRRCLRQFQVARKSPDLCQ